MVHAVAGELTEVYYPRLDTPSVRDLELVVSEGRTFTRARVGRDAACRAAARRAHVPPGQHRPLRRYRITKTWVTWPRREAVLADVRFESLDGRRYRVYVRVDPGLRDDGDRDRGRTLGRTLTVRG